MNPMSRIRIRRICLAGATALVLAAPAGAHIVRVNEGGSSMFAQYGWGAAASVAKGQSNDVLAQYGWGAAATFAKQQTRTALAAKADNDFLAQFGWGAAATYAKLHA
jgi:hypothetical protein